MRMLRAFQLTKGMLLIAGATYLSVWHGREMSWPLIALLVAGIAVGVRRVYAVVSGHDPLVSALQRLARKSH